MKNTILFLILTTGWLVSKADDNRASGQPCAAIDDQRGISGMKEILLKKGDYYDNLRTAYADAVNYAVGRTVITADSAGMEYLLQNTKLFDASFIVPAEYENGVRYDNDVRFTNLIGQSCGKWAAFELDGVDYPYSKPCCMNPQKRKAKPNLEKKSQDEIKKPDENFFKKPVDREEFARPQVDPLLLKSVNTQTTTVVQPKKHHGFWWWFWKGVIVCAIGGVVDWAVHQGSSPPPGGPGSAPLTTH